MGATTTDLGRSRLTVLPQPHRPARPPRAGRCAPRWRDEFAQSFPDVHPRSALWLRAHSTPHLRSASLAMEEAGMADDQERTERATGSISRRGLIGGGAVVGTLAAFGGVITSPSVAGGKPGANGGRPGGAGSSALGFTAVGPSQEDTVVV